MGRWYHGQIHGKFWFGVQSSDAMVNYGAHELPPDFMFKSCGCCCDCEPDEKDYCEGCYESYEEHIQDIRDQEDDDNITECFEPDESNGNYEYDTELFEDQGLPYIEKHEEFFNKYIESLTFNEDNDYAYEINWTKEDFGADVGEIIADLCMLKQIQHFFQKEGVRNCSWNAEY